MRFFSLCALAAFCLLVLLPASSLAKPRSRPCPALIDRPLPGERALEAVGDDLGAAARRSRLSEERLSAMLEEDDSTWLNRCGRLFFQEPKAPSRSSAASKTHAAVAPLPLSQTFALHSKPGSSKVIYLNFRGYASLVDTRWGSSTSGYVVRPFSIDSDTASLSAGEHQAIQRVWATVAEDFAAFDVDVTTQAPTVDALMRTTFNDNNYGVVVGITDRMPWAPACSCGGRALTSSFGIMNEPATPSAWVVTAGAGTAPYDLGLAASHEAGHTMGLAHWGYTQDGSFHAYNPGLGPYWGPIMGNPYGKALTQWSNGDYAYATNPYGGFDNDNVRVLSARTPPRPDDFSDSISSAFSLGSGPFSKPGLISTRTDVDWFSFSVTSTQTVDLTAVTDDYAPNLDVELSLFDSSGQQVALSNPEMCATSSNRSCGTSAYISRSLAPGTYFVKVDGVGYGPPADLASYSDYGSLGSYRLVRGPALDITNSSLPTATVGEPFKVDLGVSGVISDMQNFQVYPTYVLPDWVQLTRDPATGAYSLSGAAPQAGQFPVELTLEDSLGRRKLKSYTLVVSSAPPPTLSPASLPTATRLKTYRAVVTASSPERSYQFSVSGLPSGLSVAARSASDPSLVIYGTPTVEAGTFNVTVTVSTPSGQSVSRTLPLVVAPLPLPGFSASSLPRGVVGQPYSGNLGLVRGAGSTSASLWSGSLPRGITLRSGGILTGTPQVAAESYLSFSAQDSFDQQVISPVFRLVVVVQSPVLASASATVARDGRIPASLACRMPGGCSPGQDMLTISRSGRSAVTGISWPAISYRAVRVVHVPSNYSAVLEASPGSSVSLALP